MSALDQLKHHKAVEDTTAKLQKINSMLSYYEGETSRINLAVEAYDLLRLQTTQELADLTGDIKPIS